MLKVEGDRMRKWGPYKRSSFSLNPSGDSYGNMYPVSWKKMEEASFLEMNAESIMRSIRDSVEESLGRQLPYDWAFPERPRPEKVKPPLDDPLADVPPYKELPPVPEEEEVPAAPEEVPEDTKEELKVETPALLQLRGLISEKYSKNVPADVLDDASSSPAPTAADTARVAEPPPDA